MMVKVINFAHPLTESNLQEIETLAGCEVSEVIEVPSQIDPNWVSALENGRPVLYCSTCLP